MSLSEEIRQQLINSFKVEQREHTMKIAQGLLALEKDPSGEGRALLDEIFREAHSLKGSARAVGMTTIESLGHGLEEVLLRAKEGRLEFSPELFDLLHETLDAVEDVIEQIEKGNTAPPLATLQLLARLNEALPLPHPEEAVPAGPAVSWRESPPPPDAEAEASASLLRPMPDDETIRVPVSKLDSLMAQFGELLTAKVRAEQRLAELRQMQGAVNSWHKEWLKLRRSYNRIVRNGENGYHKDTSAILEFVAQNQAHLRHLNAQFDALSRQIANDNLHLEFMLGGLEEEIKQVRMLPLSTIMVSFERMVRDMARQQNKQIALTVTGGQTELDKRVLEQLKSPLIHLLRNAVDHGIEAPETRRQKGKPAEGRITLNACQQGNHVLIEIHDDGSGLDLAAIRRAAIHKELLPADDANRLGEADVAMLIFQSGLSTSKMITDISGRGVGLDVVRQNVEQLQGTLRVASQPDRGSTFYMVLPLALVSARGIFIRAGDQRFVLPVAGVERIIEVAQDDVFKVEDKRAITYENKPVAIAWLEDLLVLPPGPQNGHAHTVVIITAAEKRLGLIVEALEGEQEMVVKTLGRQLVRVGGIAGATILGSGDIVLVLQPADLVKLAAQTTPRQSAGAMAAPQKKAEKKSILVVDDSITTRTLEKNILEAAGYQVRLATNGEEAFGALGAGSLPDLIVTDINMPRLDGFELTTRIKRDGRYQAIPVILVTSLDSPADKARGIEVGADAYIVKSRFDQGNLLDTIEQLI